MNYEECKVKLGEKNGCIFKDIVYVPISPSLLELLCQIFEERALKEDVYYKQGLERDCKDFFQNALDGWKKTRETFDKINEEKEKEEKTKTKSL